MSVLGLLPPVVNTNGDVLIDGMYGLLNVTVSVFIVSIDMQAQTHHTRTIRSVVLQVAMSTTCLWTS